MVVRNYLFAFAISAALFAPINSVAALESEKSSADEAIETVTIYKGHSQKKIRDRGSRTFRSSIKKAGRSHYKEKHEKERDLLVKALASGKLKNTEPRLLWQMLTSAATETGDFDLALEAQENLVKTFEQDSSQGARRQRFVLAKEYFLRDRFSDALAIADLPNEDHGLLSATQSLLAAQLYYKIGNFADASEFVALAHQKAELSPVINPDKSWHMLAEHAAAKDASLDIAVPVAPLDIDQEAGSPLPLVRIQPQYPLRASDRNIEGHVILRYATMADGSVNPERILMVEAEPKGYFEKAAVGALILFKYQPVVVDGVPLAYEWLTMKFEFKTR